MSGEKPPPPGGASEAKRQTDGVSRASLLLFLSGVSYRCSLSHVCPRGREQPGQKERRAVISVDHQGGWRGGEVLGFGWLFCPSRAAGRCLRS